MLITVKKLILLALLLFPCTVYAENNSVLTVRYPAYPLKELSYARLQQYKQELLRLSLVKSGREFHMQKVATGLITSDRNMRNLAQGIYDVNWMHTNREREQEMLPVRIPIFKGLIGWRLLLVHRDYRDNLRAVESLEELKKLKLGQGHDWPDTALLDSHSFNIVKATDARTVMNMLKGKRIHAFPRSIVEIWGEHELFAGDDVVIDESLALVYPTAFYTFVSSRRPGLAMAIEEGMEKAVVDGSFDRLFRRYFDELIERAELPQRRIFRLDNHELSAATPLDRPELWFDQEGALPRRDKSEVRTAPAP